MTGLTDTKTINAETLINTQIMSKWDHEFYIHVRKLKGCVIWLVEFVKVIKVAKIEIENSFLHNAINTISVILNYF